MREIKKLYFPISNIELSYRVVIFEKYVYEKRKFFKLCEINNCYVYLDLDVEVNSKQIRTLLSMYGKPVDIIIKDWSISEIMTDSFVINKIVNYIENPMIEQK